MKPSINYFILALAVISIIFISGCGSQISEGNSQGAGEENAIPPTVSGSCPSKYDGTY